VVFVNARLADAGGGLAPCTIPSLPSAFVNSRLGPAGTGVGDGFATITFSSPLALVTNRFSIKLSFVTVAGGTGAVGGN
jgi:hypothetical protein